jgi:hypothetical protein
MADEIRFAVSDPNSWRFWYRFGGRPVRPGTTVSKHRQPMHQCGTRHGIKKDVLDISLHSVSLDNNACSSPQNGYLWKGFC